MDQQNENFEIISIFASLLHPLPIELSYLILDYAEKWIPKYVEEVRPHTIVSPNFDRNVKETCRIYDLSLSSRALCAGDITSLRRVSFEFEVERWLDKTLDPYYASRPPFRKSSLPAVLPSSAPFGKVSLYAALLSSATYDNHQGRDPLRNLREEEFLARRYDISKKSCESQNCCKTDLRRDNAHDFFKDLNGGDRILLLVKIVGRQSLSRCKLGRCTTIQLWMVDNGMKLDVS